MAARCRHQDWSRPPRPLRPREWGNMVWNQHVPPDTSLQADRPEPKGAAQDGQCNTIRDELSPQKRKPQHTRCLTRNPPYESGAGSGPCQGHSPWNPGFCLGWRGGLGWCRQQPGRPPLQPKQKFGLQRQCLCRGLGQRPSLASIQVIALRRDAAGVAPNRRSGEGVGLGGGGVIRVRILFLSFRRGRNIKHTRACRHAA